MNPLRHRAVVDRLEQKAGTDEFSEQHPVARTLAHRSDDPEDMTDLKLRQHLERPKKETEHTLEGECVPTRCCRLGAATPHVPTASHPWPVEGVAGHGVAVVVRKPSHFLSINGLCRIPCTVISVAPGSFQIENVPRIFQTHRGRSMKEITESLVTCVQDGQSHSCTRVLRRFACVWASLTEAGVHPPPLRAQADPTASRLSRLTMKYLTVCVSMSCHKTRGSRDS